MGQIPEFEEIDQKFCAFKDMVIGLQEGGRQPTMVDTLGEIWASAKLIAYIKWNGIEMFANIRKEGEIPYQNNTD